MELIVDEEFKNLLPRLSSEEYFNLEQQIKKDGVLNPIITWKGIIVDGHNRYSICKANGIEFPVKEKEFADRNGVIEWILRHQLGRRNLTDFQRNEIALRYEEVITRQKKQRQLSGLKRGNDFPCVSFETHGDKGRTTDKLGQIAGTSRSSVERTKTILKKGTPEQIERARKGGHEFDGRSNSIAAIAKEISNSVETKVCTCCKRTLPITEFYSNGKGGIRSCCKKCYCTTSNAADLKRNRIKGSNIEINDDLYETLYDENREIVFTITDLIEEITVNGNSGIQNIQTSLSLHKELLSDVNNKKLINEVIDSFIGKLKNLKER